MDDKNEVKEVMIAAYPTIGLVENAFKSKSWRVAITVSVIVGVAVAVANVTVFDPFLQSNRPLQTIGLGLFSGFLCLVSFVLYQLFQSTSSGIRELQGQLQIVKQENEALKISLNKTKELNESLVKSQSNAIEALKVNRNATFDIERQLEQILRAIDDAIYFLDNADLMQSTLKTTYVQLHGEELIVNLPIGARNGMRRHLVYYLNLPSKNSNLEPTPIGMAISEIIHEERSVARVNEHATNESVEFWDKIRRKCEIAEDGEDHLLELSLVPFISAELKGCTKDTLITIKTVFRDLLQQINTTQSPPVAQSPAEYQTLRRQQ